MQSFNQITAWGGGERSAAGFEIQNFDFMHTLIFLADVCSVFGWFLFLLASHMTSFQNMI